MKKYNKLNPEVIVGLGERTEFLEKEPPFKTVRKLHIELEDWLGDDIMKCHPCYIVTESVKIDLEKSVFTGFEFDNMEVTKGEYFLNNYQLKKNVPEFYFMKIIGKEGSDDLFLDDNLLLSIDEIFLDYLKHNFALNYSAINPQRDKFDDLLDQMTNGL